MSIIPTNIERVSESWAERGEHWQHFSTEPRVRGRKSRFQHKPLILSGHGVSLRVDRGTLIIRNGFTHHPQTREEHRFFPRDRRLPSRIVLIDVDGAITFDALEWLSAQYVPLVQINWRGEVITTSGGLGYGADLEIVRAQLDMQNKPAALSFACHLIQSKILASIDTIQNVFAPSPAAELATAKLNEQLLSIRRQPPTSISALLGAEGLAGVTYFRCWHSRPIRWKSISRKPIPDDWQRVGARMTTDNSNQFASHPVNAMLNYAYGMLENQVRTVAVTMGFDPTIGVLHAYQRNKPTLVLDLMEPLRPIIDRKILEFIQSNIFSPADFTINQMGVCKLHPQLARVVVKLVQDISDMDHTVLGNLNRLLENYDSVAKKAVKNHTQFLSKVVGKRA